MEERKSATFSPKRLSDEWVKKLSQDSSFDVCHALLSNPRNFCRLTAEEIIASVSEQSELIRVFRYFVHMHPEDHVLIKYYSKHSDAEIRDYFSNLLNDDTRDFDAIRLVYDNKPIDILPRKISCILDRFLIEETINKEVILFIEALVHSDNLEIRKIAADIHHLATLA